MRRTLELLSGKWRLYVLYVLSKASVCRFGALKRAIPGITSTMLTHALRDLETLGIVHREQFNEVPPHVEYSLTEKGLALLPVFLLLGVLVPLGVYRSVARHTVVERLREAAE